MNDENMLVYIIGYLDAIHREKRYQQPDFFKIIRLFLLLRKRTNNKELQEFVFRDIGDHFCSIVLNNMVTEEFIKKHRHESVYYTLTKKGWIHAQEDFANTLLVLKHYD